MFYPDSAKLGEYLELKNVDIEQLSTSLCDKRIRLDAKEPSVLNKDPLKRALEYKSLIETGVVKNQSELAAYLGTSRAWVSKVLKQLKRKSDKNEAETQRDDCRRMNVRQSPKTPLRNS